MVMTIVAVIKLPLEDARKRLPSIAVTLMPHHTIVACLLVITYLTGISLRLMDNLA